MSRTKKLQLTEAILARVAIIRICAPHVRHGGYGLTPTDFELLKAELADEVLAEIQRHEALRRERIEQVDASVHRQLIPVDLERRQKRRSRA